MDIVFEVFFLLGESHSYIATAYGNLFNGGTDTRAKGIIKESGIEAFGWYAWIVDAAGSITKVKETERINFHDFFNYFSIHRAHQILKQPIPAK